MDFSENLKRGVLTAFVAHQLEIPDRPELNVFPFNVLFMQWTVKGGKAIYGSAVYEPELMTFHRTDTGLKMQYRNIYGGDGRLVMYYYPALKQYTGKKFVNGILVGEADGNEWKIFFVQLTALGLTNGERCKFGD